MATNPTCLPIGLRAKGFVFFHFVSGEAREVGDDAE
jgi:hypothetical protein